MRVFWVILLLSQVLVFSSCNCADEYYYQPNPTYTSVLAIRDLTDTIRSIKYDAKADIVNPNKTIFPVLISYLIPTWVEVKTDKNNFRFRIVLDAEYGYINDRFCGQGGSTIVLKVPSFDSITGGNVLHKRLLFKDGYYDKAICDSIILTP